MKLKIWMILIGFVLILFISSKGVNAQCDDARSIFNGPGLEWLLKKVKKPYTLDELAKIFRARDLTLSTHFVRGNFEKIGEYYGPGGMVRNGGEYIFGSKNISMFFANLKSDRKVDVVIFNTVKVYIDVDEYLANNESVRKDTDNVYTIIEIISMSYIENNLVITGITSRDAPHPWPTFRNGDWPRIKDLIIEK